MTLFRAVALSLSLTFLAACGGSGSSDSSENTDSSVTTLADTELEATGEDAESAAAVDAELTPISGCFVKASELDLTPVWAGQLPGLAAVVSRDGEEIYTTAAASADSSGNDAFSDVDVELGRSYAYSIQTIDADGNLSEPVACGSGQLLAQSSEIACGIRVSDAGLPEISWQGVLLVQEVAVLRDGTEIDADVNSPFVDTRAPADASSSYSIVVTDATDQGRESQTIECGTATPNVADAAGSFDLAGAIESASNFLSPFQFVVLEPLCSGCSGTVELYLVPGDTDHVVDQVWIGGSASSERGELWMIDPLAVATRLADAERSGSVVTYDIDIDTGLVRSWTIDGVGARYECFEVDTRPLDMRTRECTANIFNS